MKKLNEIKEQLKQEWLDDEYEFTEEELNEEVERIEEEMARGSAKTLVINPGDSFKIDETLCNNFDLMDWLFDQPEGKVFKVTKVDREEELVFSGSLPYPINFEAIITLQ